MRTIAAQLKSLTADTRSIVAERFGRLGSRGALGINLIELIRVSFPYGQDTEKTLLKRTRERIPTG
jgi:hypothetical protein